MEELTLLEILATSAFPAERIKELCRTTLISSEMKEVLLSHDSDNLKKTLTPEKHFANETYIANF